jgi:hypothetical protein
MELAAEMNRKASRKAQKSGKPGLFFSVKNAAIRAGIQVASSSSRRTSE